MSKFKVGDEVMYLHEYKAVIFGVADEPDSGGDQYAISYFSFPGYKVNIVTQKDELKLIEKGCEGWRYWKRILEKWPNREYWYQDYTEGKQFFYHCPFCGSKLAGNGCTYEKEEE